jgi:hypothetical protein
LFEAPKAEWYKDIHRKEGYGGMAAVILLFLPVSLLLLKDMCHEMVGVFF